MDWVGTTTKFFFPCMRKDKTAYYKILIHKGATEIEGLDNEEFERIKAIPLDEVKFGAIKPGINRPDAGPTKRERMKVEKAMGDIP